MKKILLSFSVLCFLSWKVMATNYPMTTGTYTVDCSLLNNNFFDSGSQLNPYSNNENYTETFTSSSGQSLKFKFTAFSTQQGNDILTIYDGPTTAAPVIGLFSGTNSPGIIISSTPSLTFVFVSNSTTTSSGWTASIQCTAPANSYTMAAGTVTDCDAIFYDPSGSSGTYANNLNVTETIKSSTIGYCPTITFYSMDIGSGDVLSVYDGLTTASQLIKSYAGAVVTASPASLLSSSGSLTFKFTSNGTNNANAGWYALIGCDPCPSALAATATYTMPTSVIAGGYLGANMVTTCSGTIADNGGLSLNYSNNVGDQTYGTGYYRVFCPSTANNCLRMQLYKLRIKTTDYLLITNSATQTGTTLATLTNTSCTSYANCMGAGYGPYTSYDPSGCLSLMFYSNGNSNDSGFAATLDCVPCATGPTGTDNTDCTNATPLCGSTSFTAASLGPGLVSEGGGTCLGSENYSSWYSIKFSNGGTLGFTIASIATSPYEDYDFALFGPGTSCGSLGSPIRCSYGQVTNNGKTGMRSSEPNNNFSDPAGGDGWVYTLNVTTGQTYYLLVSKWSTAGSGFTLTWNLTNGASLDCSLLPVTLTSFTCAPENGWITLDWTTESEVDNDHYVIERSSDGENFSVFTTMPGKGTTTMPSEYFVADYHPLPGDNYYRLSQVDKDGSQEILKTTACSSPVSNEQVTLRVFDMSGRLVHSSSIEMSDLESTLRGLDLPSGVYVTALLHSNGRYDLSKYLKLAQAR